VQRPSIDSPCGCEHNNPDSLDARLFPFVVLAVAPAVTTDEVPSLLTGKVGLRVGLTATVCSRKKLFCSSLYERLETRDIKSLIYIYIYYIYIYI